MLNVTAVKTIRMSPDKRNVKYIVEKAKGVFLWGDLDQDWGSKITQIIVHQTKGADESMTRVDSSVPLMYHDLSDLGSLILIQITPKECILRVNHRIPLIGLSMIW